MSEEKSDFHKYCEGLDMDGFPLEETEMMRKYAETHGCGAEAQRQCGMVKAPDRKRPSPCYECVPVFPMPCVRDEHGAIREQTIKRLFAKIDEEFDELKAAVLSVFYGLDVVPSDRSDLKNIGADEMPLIASEAADVKTAITTLEEALGIGAAMRDEAQRQVNRKNRKRGRL